MNIQTTRSRHVDVLTVVRLPGRLSVEQAAVLLGFQVHDIQVLMSHKLLQPLGKPAPNAPKWFASCEIEELRSDRNWLSTATKVLGEYWKKKRLRRSHEHYPNRPRPDDTAE